MGACYGLDFMAALSRSAGSLEGAGKEGLAAAIVDVKQRLRAFVSQLETKKAVVVAIVENLASGCKGH
ncbi:hypothetical protein CfE428DRAFT_3953 [Chthoniobacter flavus Ellin428]|uniref:Uncharacterized protein n=1 Tax=Chthoniobacter flavus Ellin428 TaxID=497964 RepID=B4D4W5_9BACT|nr:hypothetical protein CfE428DRAFT_3953 [Chthoniobacter flavus Ellin428]TCO90977.1 hypothetical protein EV701_109127 [Chthoniobacter flavus]